MAHTDQMGFVPMADLTGPAFRQGYAVPAFCAWNAETMEAVLQAAERLHAPVILMQGPGEFPVLSPASMGAVAAALKNRYSVAAALHLDHGDSLQMVTECIEARYTSVMLDFSSRPHEENARAQKAVIAMARPRGITVEGEIGRIGKADDMTAEGAARSLYTDPAEAVSYVRESGVDLLAVSIGNKHGFYHGEPHLEFGLLAELHAAIAVPLVMHGGTGISAEDIQRSIGMGIAKVNVASELVHGFRASLTGQWQEGRNHWTPLALAAARAEVQKIAEKWIRITGAAGKSA
jgi:tagatose 1,6-diphosphate aldolase GatY/KbaY